MEESAPQVVFEGNTSELVEENCSEMIVERNEIKQSKKPNYITNQTINSDNLRSRSEIKIYLQATVSVISTNKEKGNVIVDEDFQTCSEGPKVIPSKKKT